MKLSGSDEGKVQKQVKKKAKLIDIALLGQFLLGLYGSGLDCYYFVMLFITITVIL